MAGQFRGPPQSYCPHCMRVGRGSVPFIPVWTSEDEAMWLCKNWHICPFPYIDGPEAVQAHTVPIKTIDPTLLHPLKDSPISSDDVPPASFNPLMGIAAATAAPVVLSTISMPTASPASPLPRTTRPLMNRQATKQQQQLQSFPSYVSQNDPSAVPTTTMSASSSQRDARADLISMVTKKLAQVQRNT